LCIKFAFVFRKGYSGHVGPHELNNEERTMTNCPQIPALLADAEQQLSALPPPSGVLKFCRDETGTHEEYLACLQWVGTRRRDLTAEISTLRRDNASCNVIVGPMAMGTTWTITTDLHSGLCGRNMTIQSSALSGQLRIETWDNFTQALTGRIDVPVASFNLPSPPPLNINYARFHADTLGIEINLPSSTCQVVYTGTLDFATRTITGTVAGVVDIQASPPGMPHWSATKL
jgi:hypothetical protein